MYVMVAVQVIYRHFQPLGLIRLGFQFSPCLLPCSPGYGNPQQNPLKREERSIRIGQGRAIGQRVAGSQVQMQPYAECRVPANKYNCTLSLSQVGHEAGAGNNTLPVGPRNSCINRGCEAQVIGIDYQPSQRLSLGPPIAQIEQAWGRDHASREIIRFGQQLENAIVVGHVQIG